MLGAIAVVPVVLVAAWFVFQRLSEPDPPSAFYTPPAELPAGPPGTIIRSQSIGSRADGSEAWRVLYTSTAPDGSPIAVSGVVVAPPGAAPDNGWPVVAWAHGTTGVVPRCAPSLEEDAGLARVPALDELLAAGTVVAVTDYPGLGTPGIHPYLVGESEGRVVLDSIRDSAGLLGDQVGERAGVYGHSQGGHSALFADQLAATYAPDVPLAGVAAMAPPTDLADLLRLDSTETAGIVLTALALTSWSTWFPNTHLSAIVHPVAEPVVERVGHRCIATTDQGLSDLPDVATLKVQFLSGDPADAPGWGEHLRQNAPSAISSTIPLLVSQGLTDTIVRPTVTEAFVHAQCATGASIELDTYAGVDHFAVRTAAAPKVSTWLLDRRQGKPATPGCTTEQD